MGWTSLLWYKFSEKRKVSIFKAEQKAGYHHFLNPIGLQQLECIHSVKRNKIENITVGDNKYDGDEEV